MPSGEGRVKLNRPVLWKTGMAWITATAAKRREGGQGPLWGRAGAQKYPSRLGRSRRDPGVLEDNSVEVSTPGEAEVKAANSMLGIIKKGAENKMANTVDATTNQC